MLRSPWRAVCSCVLTWDQVRQLWETLLCTPPRPALSPAQLSHVDSHCPPGRVLAVFPSRNLGLGTQQLLQKCSLKWTLISHHNLGTGFPPSFPKSQTCLGMTHALGHLQPRIGQISILGVPRVCPAGSDSALPQPHL